MGWHLKKLKDGRTQIIYISHTLYNGWLPNMVVDIFSIEQLRSVAHLTVEVAKEIGLLNKEEESKEELKKDEISNEEPMQKH